MITEKQRLKAAREVVYRYKDKYDYKDYEFLFGAWIVPSGLQRFTNAIVAVQTNKHIGLPTISTNKQFNMHFVKLFDAFNKTKQYCEIQLSEADIKRIGIEGQKEYYADNPDRLIQYGKTWITKWNLYLAVYALGGEDIKLKYFMDDNKDKIAIISENGAAVIAFYDKDKDKQNDRP